MKFVAPFLAIVCICAPFEAAVVRAADVPHSISYQGMLLDTTGHAIVDGAHVVRLRLYADAAGQAQLWQSIDSVQTARGVFNIILGRQPANGLPPVAMLNRSLWLGIQVDRETEMRPLTLLTATPYALNVADSAIGTAKVQDGAITADKIAPDFVGRVFVNGRQISTKGGDVELAFGNNIDWSIDSTTPGRVQVRVNAPASNPSVNTPLTNPVANASGSNHIAVTQSAPPTAVALPGAGPHAWASLTDASDVAGVLTVHLDANAASGGIARVTFATPYVAPPIVLIQPADKLSFDGYLRETYVTRTAAGFDLVVSVPHTGAVTYTYYYQVIGAQ